MRAAYVTVLNMTSNRGRLEFVAAYIAAEYILSAVIIYAATEFLSPEKTRL